MAQKRKRNKKYIFWMTMLVLLVVAAAVAYLVWDGYFKDKGETGDKGSDGQQAVERVEEKKEATGKDAGEEIKKEQEDVREEEEEKKVAQYEGDDPNKSEAISGVVTYAGVSGNKLIIRVNIDQFLGGGQCNLILVRDGTIIYGEATSVISSASTSTCEGFDVPVEGLGGGVTEVRIDINDGNKKGTIVGEVNL